MKTRIVLITIVAISLLVTGIAMAGIKNSKHDLSSGSTTTSQKSDVVGSGGTDQLCVFCHTPHNATAGFNPLWNKSLNSTTYATYGTTINGTANVAGTLSGVTKACLSCHDGVNAINSVVNLGGAASNVKISGAAAGAVTIATAGNLGTNLTNDHPVSLTYIAGNASLRALSGTGSTSVVKVSANATAGTDLPVGSGAAAKVECSSCHDPHGTGNGYFLRATTNQSNICLVCHNK
ncbi:MAG: hypothetical protein EPN22_13030 [Nitrospirae bacterium]|nr:MAG: hypothetical protein EPN22_13030 [Nitrospirota bacterium]